MIRIVKLTLREDKLDEFLDFYQTVKPIICNYRGCQSLRLLQDIHKPTTVFTFSEWTNEYDLENYRISDTFQLIWSTMKPWFSQQADAWSTKQQDDIRLNTF